MGRRWRHPSEAEWAAYLDDDAELGAGERAELRAHLEGCARCQGALERVDGVRRLLRAPPPEPDELSWRRMEARLEAAQRSMGVTGYYSMDLPAGTASFEPRGDPRTVDIVRGRRWLLAGLAAAVVVAGFIALAPRQGAVPAGPAPSSVAARGPSERAAEIASGAAAFEVELESGVRLALSSWTQLVVPEPDAEPVRVELDAGRVDIWTSRPMPEAPAGRAPVLVRTPDIDVWARSRDFSVAYQAGRHRIEVREGEVEVEDGRARQTIRAGESRDIDAPWAGPAEPRLALLERLRGAKPGSEAGERAGPRALREPRARRRRAPPAPAPEAEPGPSTAARPRASVAERPAEPFEPGGPKTDVGAPRTQITVERLEPATLPAEAALADARRAWFESRDADAAVRATERVLRLTRDPGLVRAAHELRCDAEVSRRSGTEAVRACAELLRHERDASRTRRIHYTIATIHRMQLGDCRAAIDHYGRAIVFGRRSRFDDAVRLRRAECALDLGELDMARIDLERLNGRVAERERLREARARLAILEKEARNGTDDAE